MACTPEISVDELRATAEREPALSDWINVSQDMIDDFAQNECPSWAVVEFELTGTEYQYFRLTISLDGDGYLFLVTKALKNLCRLLRVSQCRPVDILDQIARP